MTDAATICKRLAQLKEQRSTHEAVWRDCFNRTYPIRSTGLSSTTLDPQTALDKAAQLLDGTGTESAAILTKSLMSGLTPANSRWATQEVPGETALERVWLEETADLTWKFIHASNFDSQAYECMLDLVCAGWGVLYIDEGRAGLDFQSWPIGQCYLIAAYAGGPIVAVYREFDMTAEQAVRVYGDEVSDKTRAMASDKPDTKVCFVHVIEPRKDYRAGSMMAKNLPIASCHVEVATKKIVRESGYHEMPVVVPRWGFIPASPYAIGPAYEALPDMNMLNELKRMELAAADIAVAGMWKAVDDGVLNPRTVKVGPRKIVTMADINSMEPLETGSNFQVAFTAEERLQGAIKRRFMADQLTPQDGPAMTATEVHARVQMIRQMLGPVYGRLQPDYLAPLWERCFGIAMRAGQFPPPPDTLADREIQIKYISPIARAQGLEDVAAMDQYESVLVQEAQVQPKVMDTYDWDGAARLRAKLMGVPAQLTLDDEAVQQIRDTREQQAAQQQMQATMSEGAVRAAPEIVKRVAA